MVETETQELPKAKVSILFIIDSYFVNRYAIETALKYCKETFVELIFVNNTGEKSVSDFFNNIIKNEKFENVLNVLELEETITFNHAQAFNKLLAGISTEYVCIFDAHCIVGKNWLYDSLYYHSLADKVCCVAIPEFETKKVYTGVLDKNDEIVNVFTTKDGSVEGICLFRSDLLNEQNCFNDENEKEYLKEFQLKCLKENWKSFYVPAQIQIDCKVKG